MSFLFLLALVVVGFVMLAGTIVSSFAPRMKSPTPTDDDLKRTTVFVPPPAAAPSGLFSRLTSAACVASAVGVLALVTGRVAPRFMEVGRPPASIAEVPEPLHVELNDPGELHITVKEGSPSDKRTDGESTADAEVPEALDGKAARPEPKPLPAEKPVPGRKHGRLRKAAEIVVDKLTGRKDEPDAESEVEVDGRDLSHLPEWARKPVVTVGERTLVVVSSREHPTLKEADDEARQFAAARIRKDFEKHHPTLREPFDWTVPESAVPFLLVYEEKVPHQAGNVNFTMFRVHRQFEVTDETRSEVFAAWRSGLRRHRLFGMGAVLGTLGLIVAASSLYLRLDAQSRGAWRGRLKAATATAILVGGVAAASVV